MFRKRASLFVIVFLVVGIFFVALPEKGYSVAINPLGCCQTGGDTCSGCESLGDCVIRENECIAFGGISVSTDQICDLNMSSCTFPTQDAVGCCVITEGKCNENRKISGCEAAGGMAWYLETQCSEIPDCDRLPRNVPTLSEWSLIALAVVLVIVGLLAMRRRKAAV